MNYRHLFHAGNFADVMKHALLIELIGALQKKEKGIFYLDTHAGRGSYDLGLAARGDTLERQPEWPDGIGRILAARSTAAADANATGDPLRAYADLVRRFDAERGNTNGSPRFYPGSPAIAQVLVRRQDRLALCEQVPEEHALLAAEFARAPRTSVHAIDGYVAVRAMLPPPERRALVLIDAPFEAQDEFARIETALAEGLARLPAGVFAVWYPLTERARVDAFFAGLAERRLPPTLVLELAVAGENSALKMRGCGLVVVNPPWHFERTAAPILEALARELAQAPGAAGRQQWLVPEK
ncbi:23S rRNA (adenine(2030)-N(6))-methyltransferase RlmJ [Opitutus terrae]|uniref:Ribosomal RNA large subunit methyltransferase J n=1 Tax=Opitutus terrae (strain DSM 11246 / JCM 15787 / PB90-1) TaxID=452637 RepID=B1ZS65_OPITP|nr:23S rRNA (adenine(2030)-N(6))-methyltransferase RlmJ [Opitutus terrae]ACB75664.1 protein of unknown function DUF519 [Opitutus terrae PB90-1]